MFAVLTIRSMALLVFSHMIGKVTYTRSRVSELQDSPCNYLLSHVITCVSKIYLLGTMNFCLHTIYLTVETTH